MKDQSKMSIYLKFIIGIASSFAVFLACLNATRDGYTNWYKRLLYFTQQSNIWIGSICLVIAILLIVEKVKNKKLVKDYLYVLKYIFTVSITITGIIFCTLLAPFADFDIWVPSSILTHIVVPILSIIDFFIDDKEIILKKKHILLTLIPPLFYFIFSIILSSLNIDFGRGDPFPYFFLNFNSEAGLFGYIPTTPPQFGTMYWIIFILLLILGLSILYYYLHIPTRKNHKESKKAK